MISVDSGALTKSKSSGTRTLASFISCVSPSLQRFISFYFLFLLTSEVGEPVNYGKDRCAYTSVSAGPKPRHPQASVFGPFGYGPAMMAGGAGAAAGGAGANRTVYLSNIRPETMTEDLRNAIRGGVLQIIRYKDIVVRAWFHFEYAY